MTFGVITIARTLSAGGEELGRSLAAEFGMRYVDGEILDQAAARAGVTAEEVSRTEARSGLVKRIFESFAFAAFAGGGSDVPATPAMTQAPGYQQLIVEVIRETAAAGNAVIVAHGAAIPLAQSEGILRVLVTASPATRIARQMALGRSSKQAQRNVGASDADRVDFFRRFYALEYEESTHYDLVFNTDRLSVSDAAKMIRALRQA